MASITEYLLKLQDLTQQNLDILQALNDSFFTKQNHLSVKVGDNHYAIPSFISLENKINSLTSNFNNLVNAPENGEAFFNFDGNSRSIQVRPYTEVPNSLVLDTVREFGAESNQIFKDFLTPLPYININLQSLPNDTTQVMVKKVIPIHSDLLELYKSYLIRIDENQKEQTIPSYQYPYKDLYKVLSIYKKDIDYIEYDKKIDLPIRKNIGSGIYVIENIIEDIVDENLDNYITLKLRTDMKDSIYMNSLKYRLFDETIERDLKVGDQLVTFDGNAKIKITEIRPNTNTIIVKVMHGEYLNLVPSDSNDPNTISSLSKLKFYSPIDFNEDKYIKVPLEEDRYIFIAVAPVNSRMNIQSAWGSGLFIDSYSLVKGEETFNSYYDNNVRNVGDILFEMVSMMSNTLTKFDGDEYKKFTSYSPTINPENILVSQINKHLNDSVVVQNIRSLYSQKKEYQNQLLEIQTEIGSINEALASVSFDDTTGIRASYIDQLSDLSSKKNSISSAITKILNEISIAANNSETPIENAKYRIRGFFDLDELEDLEDHKNHVMGIRVQYRYKNIDQEQGTASTINEKFIFSDWNEMVGFDRVKISSYDGGYKFELEEDNSLKNEPSFNQIDIPISQGETVDIRLKLIYDYGWPFTQVSSSWSPIVNVKFPEEYLKNVQILDIIEENNNDIETNRFKDIIKDEGIVDHVNDKINDQDVTYYHRPENIASGFYTEERRIIPLKDKLSDMDLLISSLKDEIMGASAPLTVSIKIGNNDNILLPNQLNKITVESYDSILNDVDGIYEKDSNGVVSVVLNLSISNNTNHTAKLFSLFPGDRDKDIYTLYNNRKSTIVSNYAKSDNLGVWFEDSLGNKGIQGGNQFLYFRIKDVYTNDPFYGDVKYENNVGYGASAVGMWESVDDNSLLSWYKEYIKNLYTPTETVAYMYPKLSNKYGLCLDSDTVETYLVLDPGDEIIVPIVFEYCIKDQDIISKTMSFDLLQSLYKDPVTYTFRVTAKNENSTTDKLLLTSKKNFRKWWGDNKIKYRPVFK